MKRATMIAHGSWLLAAALSCTSGQANDPGTSGGDASSGAGAGGGLQIDTGSGSDPGQNFEGCAETTSTAEPIPVSLFIAVDKSGSMRDDNKWSNATTAFTAFFTDPSADDLQVALRLWPTGDCNHPSCDATACSQPQVQLASLADPDHQADLIARFVDTYPNGSTPMSAALAGATAWAKERQSSTAGAEKVAVVFLTDGEPNGCENDIADISAYADDAYASAGIPTFAVGLEGSNEAQLDAIAQAGGTGKGFYIGSGNAAADLLGALKEIQSTVVSCSFLIPASSDDGKALDPKLVSVNMTSDGGELDPVEPVPSASSCGDSRGWYYDDPDKPTAIHLCPASCDAAQEDPDVLIELTIGCKSVAR